MTAVSKWGAYVLAAFMAFMGIQKFIGDVPIFIIIEDNLAADWGLTLPFIDPMLKYATGLGELAATVILVAGLRLIGGGLSLALIGGAILAHLTVLGVYTPMSSAPDAEKSPMLFIMALVFLALSAAVTYSAFKARR